ncbi:MAG TPA: hypothetical protein VF534_28945 [Paraburkholderia sp.]
MDKQTHNDLEGEHFCGCSDRGGDAAQQRAEQHHGARRSIAIMVSSFVEHGARRSTSSGFQQFFSPTLRMPNAVKFNNSSHRDPIKGAVTRDSFGCSSNAFSIVFQLVSHETSETGLQDSDFLKLF